MFIINALAARFQRTRETYRQNQIRNEEERRTELQFAREMRNRFVPGSADYRWYHATVRRLGGN